MKLALVVVGDGREEYLRRTVKSITEHVRYPITSRIMVNDEAAPDYMNRLETIYPEFVIAHTNRRGMAGAVQMGFDMARSVDPEFVLWVEEDMELTATLPIARAAAVFRGRDNLAQMCFRREPVGGNEHEALHGDQLAAICGQSAFIARHDEFTTHDFIFSLNPCLIPAKILDYGWDADNEAGMTRKLLELGYVFGSWGHPGDGQSWARHIGERRGNGWKL